MGGRRRGASLAVAAAAVLLVAPAVVDAAKAGTASEPLPSPLMGTAAVWTGEHAYLFGGSDGTVRDGIVRYDPATGQVTTMNAELPGARDNATAVWTGRHAYVFGGWDGERTLDGIVRYDPANDTLRTMDARLPEGRAGAAAVWTGEAVYLFGGREGQFPTDDVLRYDPAEDRIDHLGAVLPDRIADAAAVWTGKAAYVFGGEGYTDDVLRFDPATGRARHVDAELPTARGHLSAAWDGQYAYVLGGHNRTDRYADIVRFDPATDTVAVMETRLPSARSWTSAVWDGRHVDVFGGRTGAGTVLDQIVTYDPPNRPPTARFGIATEGLTLRVDASASWDLDGEVTGYRWRFGDGVTATGATANHTYPAAGSRTVELTVTDDDGATRTTRRTVDLTPGNRPPNASFDVIVSQRTVTLDAVPSRDPDGRIVSYRWDLGDGTTARGIDAVHFYELEGRYTVRLTVTDDQGATASTSRNVTALKNAAPRAQLDADVDGRTVHLDANGTVDPDGTGVERLVWRIDGAVVATGPTATWEAPHDGRFDVELVAVDALGRQGTARTTVEVAAGFLGTGVPPWTLAGAAIAGLSVAVGRWSGAWGKLAALLGRLRGP